jgi:acetyl esterase/lipase
MPPLCLALLAVLVLIAPEGFAQPAEPPPPVEKRTYRDAAGRTLALWIWRPADWSAADRRSAIIFFHGGGFRSGSPSQFSYVAARLARRGMVAISAEYRFITPPEVTPVECVKDARSAFRWLRGNAAEMGVHPDRIAAGGGSAGAYLAVALGSLNEFNHETDARNVSTKPAALVLWSAVLRQPRAELSPFSHITAGHPPAISFHGEADTNVPIRGVREYAAKVKQAGGDFNVVGFANADHFFSGVEPFAAESLKQAETFLEQHGLLQAGYKDGPLQPGEASFVSQHTEVPIAAGKLSEFSGVYQIDGRRKFTVVVDEQNRLRIRLTGQTFGPPTLLYAGDDRFFARKIAAEFQFQRSPDGRVTSVTLQQNGMELPAQRTAAPVPAVKFLTAEKLDEYVGKFQLADTHFEITTRPGHLLRNRPGVPRCRSSVIGRITSSLKCWRRS